MATAGTLNLVLGADSTQLRQELGKVRQESQSAALAITNLFSGDTINAVGFRLIRGTVTGLIGDIDNLNNGLSITDSLVNNLGASFADMGDIALLQLGQVAEFLGDDLFQTPLAGLQSASLERVGFGQLEGAFKIVTAGSNAVKILEVGLSGLTSSFEFLDGVLGGFQAKAQSVADFFITIANSAELVSDLLKAAATVIDGAIDTVLNSLEAVFPALGIVREGAKALGLEFSVGKSLLGDYIDQLDRIEGAATGAAESALDVSKAAGNVRGSINQADAAIDEFGGNLKAQRQAAAGFEDAMKDLADAAVLFDQWKQISDIVDGALGSFEQNFNAAVGFENLNNQLQLVSTAAGGAKEDLQFLTDTTTELGVSFDAAAEGFTQFGTAASLANLTTNETKDIFEAITQSTAVMGLSAADTQGVFLALQQILSSGNVQLEELNQIAERVPGTFQAAAAALGVTTSELKALISTGKVDSKTFLVGFAQQMKNFTDAGVTDAMDGGTAAVNRFNNALGNFQIAAGSAWVEIGTPALNTFAQALEFAAKNEELFSSAIDAVLVASIPLFISGITSAAIATFTFIAANKTAAISLFGKQLKFSAAELGKYAAQVALAYVALLVFYRVMDRLKDGAQPTRDAIKSLDKSILDLEESAKDTPSLEGLIPKEPPPTDWIDGIVHGLNNANEAANRFVGVDEKFLNITTNGEKQLNDLLVAIQDFGGRASTILGEALSLKVANEQGQGPIKEIERIDAALKQLENRKIGIDPKDAASVAAIAAEEEELLRRRADAQKQVLAVQSALNNALTQAKQELQNLDPNKLGSEGYAEAKQNLEELIAQLEQGKRGFDGIATKATQATQNIADAFKATNQQIETAYSDRQVAIAEAVANGQKTEEEGRQESLAAEREYLSQKLASNQSTLEQLKTALAQDAKLRAVDPNAAGLLTPEQLQQYQGQVEQLELDTAQTRIKIAQTVTDEKKQLLEDELAAIEQANADAESALGRSQNARIAAIRQRQLAGTLSEEEAQAQITAVEQQGIADRVAQKQQELAQVRSLRAQGKLSVEEAASQERDILDEISGLNLQRIEQELQAKQEAEEAKRRAVEEENRKAIEAVERANEKAQQAIEQSQNDRTIAVRQAQLQGVISEEEAARQIEQVQQDATADTIAQKEDEIAEVRRLRAQGTLSAEEAADRETQLSGEIGQLNLQRIENEIAAQERLKQAAIDAIEAEAEARRSELQNRSESLDLQAGAIQGEMDLMGAQTELSTALNDLENERLNTRIAAAEAAGNEQAVDRLKTQQLQFQGQQLERQFAAQKQQLKLEQEMRRIELDRQRITAEIAVIEAETALTKAIAEGASAKEIEGLQKILGLRQQQVGAVDDAIARQDELNKLQEDTLNTQQQINRERQRQSEIQAAGERRQRQEQQQDSAADSASSASPDGSTSDTENPNVRTREQGGVRYTDYSTSGFTETEPSYDPATQYRGADGRIMNRRINAAGTAAGLSSRSLLSEGAIPSDSPLRSSGLSAAAGMGTDKAALVQAFTSGNQQVVSEIQALKISILQLANSPRQLSVSSPDPIANMGQILNTVSAQRTKAARL